MAEVREATRTGMPQPAAVGQGPRRVAFYVGYPLAWAPGGHATQVRATEQALTDHGLHVTWLHNEAASLPDTDIVHYWSEPGPSHLMAVRQHGAKIVVSTLRSTGRRAPLVATLRTAAIRALATRNVVPHWMRPAATLADHVIVLNESERKYLVDAWDVDLARVTVIPNGVSDEFFSKDVKPIPFDGLVSIGHISATKSSIELAHAAKAAGIRVKFIGGLRQDTNTTADYGRLFKDLIDEKHVFWSGHVDNAAMIAGHLRGSRGLVLPSRFEAQPLAVLEALATGTPVLLSGLPHLKSTFGSSVTYCSPADSSGFPQELRAFYEGRHSTHAESFPVLRWSEIARRVLGVYDTLWDQR